MMGPSSRRWIPQLDKTDGLMPLEAPCFPRSVGRSVGSVRNTLTLLLKWLDYRLSTSEPLSSFLLDSMYTGDRNLLTATLLVFGGSGESCDYVSLLADPRAWTYGPSCVRNWCLCQLTRRRKPYPLCPAYIVISVRFASCIDEPRSRLQK